MANFIYISAINTSFLLIFPRFVKNFSIATKLIFSYLFLGIAVTFIISWFFYKTSETALINRTLDQLTSVKYLKKGWLEDYFETQKRDITLFSGLEATGNYFERINDAYKKAGINSPYYVEADSVFGGSLRQYKLNHRFLNLWLVNEDGDVIYTTVKNRYLGKNIMKYPGINSDFVSCCQHGFKEIILKDIPFISTDAPESFVLLLCPVLYGSKNGLLLVKINMEDINLILAQRTGMGATGESYVVGEDLRMRSKSRFIENGKNKFIVVNTNAAKKAFQGISGKDILKDYRGKDVLSSYALLDTKGLIWALISEIDLEEAMQPIYEIRKKVALIIFGVSLFIVAVTIYLSGKISYPVKQLNNIIKSLSKGILPDKNLEINAYDEIGQMMEAINQLTESLKKTSLFAAEIGSGNFRAAFEPLSDKDLLGHALLEMRERLVKLSAMIENQNKLRTKSLVEGQENERRRISMELHDGVGQMLTALKFKTQELDGNDKTISELKNLLDETIQEVRRASVNLMPSVLWDFGLEAALKVLIKTSGLEADFAYQTINGAKNLNMETRVCLYRIAQESLQNVLKYANNKTIEINITHSSDKITMMIVDFGKGFDLKKHQHSNTGSNGLINMQERAALLGGKVKIESAVGKGTKITVNLPL